MFAAAISKQQRFMDSNCIWQSRRPTCRRQEFLNKYKQYLVIAKSPIDAIKNADLVCTDVWVSMGDKNAVQKSRELKKYQVTKELLEQAKDNVLFMHCLPAQERQRN